MYTSMKCVKNIFILVFRQLYTYNIEYIVRHYVLIELLCNYMYILCM